MISKIDSLAHPLVSLFKDDPVRPEITDDFRVSSPCFALAISDDDNTDAIVCVKLDYIIPSSIDDLLGNINCINPKDYAFPDIIEDVMYSLGAPNIAIFYTIWSYKAGAGRDMIVQARKYIEEHFPNINTFATYSPKSEMAKRFHLKNGATIYRENTDSVNYIY